MSFSIIIATFNADKVLDRALKSILEAKVPDTEIIIIDGGSKDQTINIIKKYASDISYWITEKDNGIYDAWNKGVKAATKNWIMFLGADDILLPDALIKYSAFLKEHNKDNKLQFVSSRMQLTDVSGKVLRTHGWPWQWPDCLKTTTIAHPGSLHSKALFETYGYFDISYKSAGDFEFLIRPKEKMVSAFMNEVTVIMQEGGISDSPVGIFEHCKAAIITGGYSPLSAYFYTYLTYFKFRTKKLLRKAGVNAYIRK
ncbi:PGL/p-HBAD biosynthesis glycosyltransferase [Dyadobacter sp. CECT 9275]|uniref:PGL/p-HBAD biosynthesis glycosyltransferase n=1 Tax=Dyadobacter helix TaxID=2822344 RepID=A0A916J998_9BACT|nr:glycosyltransferase family 2 protein [Dyadobacter sp. CECT 9275]CAG4995340.1 PGL/p-HBAD biosynthesis glycosyltransferase [Dyadobacter sp. CECT 9275]